MSEMGMAMMGSAAAEGVDRARLAAEQAVASPLLENYSLNGARNILSHKKGARVELDELARRSHGIERFNRIVTIGHPRS